jgi:hypothetical protein
MSQDFMEWAGLDSVRWALLQDKMRLLAETERTPARIMMSMMNDNSIGYREQIVLTYWLGYQQGCLADEVPGRKRARFPIPGIN